MDTRLLADVMAAEGCKLRAYRDSLGFWTVGYGHLLSRDKTADYSHVVWTQTQADAVLEADLEAAQILAQSLPEWPTGSVYRQNALTELVFNMGLETWKKFAKCRACLQDGDLQGAYNELLNSLWAKQVGRTRSLRIAANLVKGAP